MKAWHLTASVDGVDIDFETVIFSEAEPGYWECDNIANENGCSLWSIEEVRDYDN